MVIDGFKFYIFNDYFSVLDSLLKDQADERHNELFSSNTTLSESLSSDVPLADNTSKSCVKDLSNVPIVSNSSSDTSVPLIENSLNVNSVDR